MASSVFGARRLVGTAGALVLLDIAMLASPAAAQDRLSVDASASMGIATNPFQQPGSSAVVLSPALEIHPIWTSERPLTMLRLEGDLQATFYSRDYGTNGNVSLQGSGTHRLSEYTTLNGSVGYSSSIIGTLTGNVVPVGTVTPIGADLPVYVNDPSLGAIGRRRQSYQGGASIVSILSPRDQVSLGIAVAANRIGGSDFSDFNYAAPSVSYNRTVSERLSVGASVNVGFTDYLGTAVGDAKIYQPSLTVTRGLSDRWTLKGAAGVAIADVNGSLGQHRTITTFNGTAGLCRRDSRWTACFDLSRQTVPSTFQGVRTTTSGVATIGYRTNETDQLSFTGGYSHSSDPLQTIPVGLPFNEALDFANASAIYSHRFRATFSGFVNLGYAKVLGGDLKRDANLTASAGVTYRFNGR